MNEEKISRIFQKAVPVWLPGKKKGWNESAGFYTQIHTAAPETITFRIAARSFYRMYLNGERIADGPARTAKGCCRADELTVRLSGEIHVAFEVLAMDFPEKYSNDCTLEPGLLAVEITGEDGRILSAAGESSWKCRRLTYRRMDVERMSHSRGIAEYYDLDGHSRDWMLGHAEDFETPVPVTEKVCFLPRRAPYPTCRRKTLERFRNLSDRIQSKREDAENCAEDEILSLSRMKNPKWYEQISPDNLFLESVIKEENLPFTGACRILCVEEKRMRKQAFNPYLPSWEYIPDGEPHVFDDRIYLYGSHDRFGSAGFCLNDYVCWSADVHDLTDWRYEGVIYRKDKDPVNQDIPADAPEQPLLFGIEPKKPEDLNPRGVHAMWAPDVAKGPDGRYYLYYCLDFLPQIRVAVCNTPAGKYEYYGMVRHRDGQILGEAEGDLIQFDPGVFCEGDEIYLYSGNAPIKSEQDTGKRASQVMRLEPDMLTLKEEPRRLLPSVTESAGTGFEGHEFFEASSIRKINGSYYFVYSSVKSSELCYALSEYPDRGYRFGGTLIDIGDIGYNGRTAEKAVNPLGNTHGGIECCSGQWYVFYHRQTDRTNFSRQGCAEKIFIKEDGSIDQAEVTSCGLNPGPLEGTGTYPARICCHLTGKNGVVFSHPMAMKEDYPYLTQDAPDLDPDSPEAESDAVCPVQYVANV